MTLYSQLRSSLLRISIVLLFLFSPSRFFAKEEKVTVKSPLNVIMITISSLRTDHIGVGGYNRETIPNFNTFSKRNICFTNAFAVSSWIMSNHESLFTSLYPHQHGATHFDNKLDEDVTTLEDVLSQYGCYYAGYFSLMLSYMKMVWSNWWISY